MAKRTEKLGAAVDTLRPYVERAITDEQFRKDLREAIQTARVLYGDLSKGNGSVKSATRFATDEKTQDQLRKTLEEFGRAGERLKGKRKSRKARRTLLVAGIVAGTLYNPWTGPQTRKWLMDKIAGDDDLQPLESFETTAPTRAEDTGQKVAETVETS